MDKAHEKCSDRSTFELKDFDSEQSNRYVSEMYETLDEFNAANANTAHSVDARYETVDDHDARLLPTNKSNRKKLFYTAAKVVFVAMLLVALAIVITYFLTSRKGDMTSSDEKRCMEYSLSNGRVVNTTGSREGDTLQVECNSASKLVGSATLTCYSTGHWSDYPRCIPKECEDFVPPSNGKAIFSSASTNIAATVLVTCEDGFVRKGTEAVVCQSNETWSDSPSCEPVDCGMPKEIKNGEIRDMTGTTYNNTFNVVCSQGYQLRGVSTVICKLSGLWEETPVCKSIVCGIPSIPKTGLLFQHAIDIITDKILVIKGQRRSCLLFQKRFKRFTPFKIFENCRISCKKAVDCGTPSVDNGDIVNVTGTKQNDAFSVRCFQGYILKGNKTVNCGNDGTWSDITECIPVSCGSPAIPINGYVDITNGTTFKSSASIKCNEGYSVKGNKDIRCKDTGEWTPIPTCELKDCSEPPIVANGEIKGLSGTTYNDSFTVECNEKYILVGFGTVVCDTNGNWTNVPACITQTNCGVPPIIKNGAVMAVTDTSTFYVKCNNGYRLTGENTLMCDFHGKWSTPPNCKLIDCGLPRNITNGEIKGLAGTKYNSTFYVECKKGYVLAGSTTVECRTTGNWSEHPVCISQTDCGVPPNVMNGELQRLTSTNNRDTFTVRCNEGFVLRGNSTVRCDFDGKWTNVPICKPVSCGIPELPKNQILINFNGTAFQSTARMECDEGFLKEGNSVITCLGNGSWTWIPPCDPIDCGTPNISNDIIKGYTDSKYRSIFYVICDEPYSLTGSWIVHCGRDGRWNLPSCKIVPCGLPEIPENGAIDSITGTMLNRTVSISCKPGFLIAGTNVVTCSGHGRWTEGPTCRSVSDCYDVYLNSNMSVSGIYNITLWKSKKKIQVYCDMDTDGGGWTVFQYRYDGSVDFYNTMSLYVNGFGNLTGEFWLGLKYIQEIARAGSKLRINLSAANGTTAYETFQKFYLRGSYYELRMDSGTGTAGDGNYGFTYNRYRLFSTRDRDYDDTSGLSCAAICHGAWWYKDCSYVNLNGEYLTPGTQIVKGKRTKGMVYLPFISESLKSSKMMIRRR